MKKKLLFVSLLSILLVSGCEEKTPSVATTVYPVQYLVERIGADNVKSQDISENTMIQRAQIKANYKDILASADALFYIGSLEPYMQMYADDIRKETDMVDLATKSAIYKFQRYTTTYVNDVSAIVESPYYEGESFDSVETYDNDPMLWMDPVAMTSMASDIRDYLVDKYPVYQKIFDENYDQLEMDLARLDADFQSIHDQHKNIAFVSMTPSFGNWQKSYGIEVYPVILSKYGALPTKGQLEIIKKRIRNDHVRYMAMESNLPEDMVRLREKLIQELGLIPVELNNVSSLKESDQKAGKDYMSIMYKNLETLESIAS